MTLASLPEFRIFVISASRVLRLSESRRTREQVFARSRVFETHYSSQKWRRTRSENFGKVWLAYEQVARLSKIKRRSPSTALPVLLTYLRPLLFSLRSRPFFARSNQLRTSSRFANFLANLKRSHT